MRQFETGGGVKAKANDITKTSVSEETGPKGQKIFTSHSLSLKLHTGTYKQYLVWLGNQIFTFLANR